MSAEVEAGTAAPASPIGDRPLVYHTCASRADVETAREVAPELDHGYGWLPEKMCAHPGRWFLDNGCYAKWLDGEPEDPDEAFWDRLASVEERMPSPPDFVVLPDIPGDACTLDHAGYYLDDVAAFGFPMYLAVHRGMPPAWQVETAVQYGCEGVFLGGDMAWKREAAAATVDEAHARGLRVHVGRPERWAAWFFEQGVDSVDTSGFVRNNDWSRLRGLGRRVEDDETTQVELGEA